MEIKQRKGGQGSSVPSRIKKKYNLANVLCQKKIKVVSKLVKSIRKQNIKLQIGLGNPNVKFP